MDFFWPALGCFWPALGGSGAALGRSGAALGLLRRVWGCCWFAVGLVRGWLFLHSVEKKARPPKAALLLGWFGASCFYIPSKRRPDSPKQPKAAQSSEFRRKESQITQNQPKAGHSTDRISQNQPKAAQFRRKRATFSQTSPTIARSPKTSPKQPKPAQSSPNQPKAAQNNPKQPKASQSSPEQPRAAQNSPEQPKTA